MNASESDAPEGVSLGPPLLNEQRPAVNLRSIGLGLGGVVFICGLTPYNDYVVANTYLVGNFLPIGLLIFLLLIICLINAPLHRWRPRAALSTSELAVIVGMCMMGCSVAASGLMRFLPQLLVAPWYQAGLNVEYAKLLDGLNLPTWIFPRFDSTSALARGNDPIVGDFIGRAPVPRTFYDQWSAVPWGAWLTPAITWLAFVASLFGAVMCLSAIVRRQWVENERLAFPLATVYLSLIESPEKGRCFNSMLRSRLFLIAFGLVFLIHSINALHEYYPRYWPEVPVKYNFKGLFADPPFIYMNPGARASTLYFSAVGITYFLQSNVAFSMWFCFIAVQVLQMFLGMQQSEITMPMMEDQRFGTLIPLTIAILWIGRHHWAMVLRRMFRRTRSGDRDDPYLSYAPAGWGFVVCTALAITWLCLAGVTVIGAVIIIMMILMLFLVVARVVAETGLIYLQMPLPLYRPWNFLSDLGARAALKDYFFSAFMTVIFVQDKREALAGFAPQALRVADGAEVPAKRRSGKLLFASMALALLVGYVTAGTSTLYVEYSHSMTLDKRQAAPINYFGADASPRKGLLDPLRTFQATGGTRDAHDRWVHFGMGAGITSVLTGLRFRFLSWPIHPVGYLLCYTYPMQLIWFSLFLGWLAKVLLVRFGGGSLFQQARPFFLGLILGEASVAGFWLTISLARNLMGLPYEAINLLPT